MVVAASLLISLASGPCTLDRVRVRTWAELFRKYCCCPDLTRDLGHLDRAAGGTLPKCSRCVLRVDQVPAERVLVLAKAAGDLDVTQLMTAREVMDHVLACAAVHLSWLEALPHAYLFNVEDGAHADANAIDELLTTQIPLEVENQEVEVGLLPVALGGSNGPQNALESALARFPVATSEDQEVPFQRFCRCSFAVWFRPSARPSRTRWCCATTSSRAGAEMGTDARTPTGQRSSDYHRRQRLGSDCVESRELLLELIACRLIFSIRTL